jgi:predicted Abi (CAAX) family protease
MSSRLLRRLVSALTTLPGPRDWLELLAAAAALALIVGPAGIATGLLRWAPRPLALIPAFSAFVIPALGEELMFRGPWIPDRSEAGGAGRAILWTTIAFVLWHMLETIWLPRAATLFTRPDFLAWAALLGLACAILRRRSGSLWPPVVLHWAAVVAWETWLGGPSGIADLR